MSVELHAGQTDGVTPPEALVVLQRMFKGDRGYSAYELAVQNGFVGTEIEWLEAQKGESGHTPIKGEDYFTPSELRQVAAQAAELVPGIPAGGDPGQVLTKTGVGDGDTAWQTPAGGSGQLPSEQLLKLNISDMGRFLHLYPFDDSGFYVALTGGVIKLDRRFNVIYRLPISILPGPEVFKENLLVKIGDKLFIATNNNRNTLAVYDEQTLSLAALPPVEGIAYYGSIYRWEDRTIRCQSYLSNDLLVYDASGQLLRRVNNEHGRMLKTDSIFFTPDGYRYDPLDDTFTKVYDNTGIGGNPAFMADDGLMIANYGYGYRIVDPAVGRFDFTNLIHASKSYILFAQITPTECVIYTPTERFQFRYPYRITNLVGRIYSFDSRPGKTLASVEKQGEWLYCLYEDGTVIIKSSI